MLEGKLGMEALHYILIRIEKVNQFFLDYNSITKFALGPVKLR
jgi:hypothetical protein